MAERCAACGCQDTFVEYLDENQTGKAFLVTRILFCLHCGTGEAKLIPA